jgi:PadR family transcriptional regulator, regulatory protein PadR
MKKATDNYQLSGLEEDILTILLGQSSVYGLQISQTIERASEGKRKIEVSSLYPALRRLEERGFVDSRWEDEDTDSKRSGARRRYYKITGEGIDTVRDHQRIRENPKAA